MKLYQLLTEAKKSLDISAAFESAADLLTRAGIQKRKLEELRQGLYDLSTAVNGRDCMSGRDWMKLKEALNDCFSEAFEKVYSEQITEQDEWQFIINPYTDELNKHGQLLRDDNVHKKVKQLNMLLRAAEENETPDSVKEKIKKLKCLAEAYMQLVEARRQVSNNLIVKKHNTSAFEISKSVTADSLFAPIKKSLKQIISGPLDELEAQLQQEYEDKVTRIKSKIKKLGGKISAPGYGKQGDLTAEQLQLFNKLFDYDILDSYSGKNAQSIFVNISPVAEIKYYASSKAKQERDRVEAAFIAKNANKLLAIISNKGVRPVIEPVGEPKITAGLIQATLKFTFPDGAKFTVINKVIINKSQSGEAFYQYPITFHGVTLSDGFKMSSPSESKMLSQFN
jgi:hypothetical protein